jgi:hypothetical protein
MVNGRMAGQMRRGLGPLLTWRPSTSTVTEHGHSREAPFVKVPLCQQEYTVCQKLES